MAGKPIFTDRTMALLDLVRAEVPKHAFVAGPNAGGDPAAGGGGGASPPPGGAPAGDPAAAAGGGAPPGMAMPGQPDMMTMVTQAVQQALAQQGGGAGGAGGAAGGLKPKIDVNVEIMQMKHMLAMLLDKNNIQMPVQDMVATPDKLNAMAQGQPTQVGQAGLGGGGMPPGGDPAAAGGMPPGGMPPGGAPPAGPPKTAAAAPKPAGRSYGSTSSLGKTSGMAAALSSLWAKHN